MDWGEDQVLSGFINKTQYQYPYKNGLDDKDEDGNVIVGVLAGQSIYGGNSANTNLTLFANSGDSGGGNTGYVQVGDNFRPTVDSSWSIGTDTERFLKIWTDEVQSGTLNLTSGSITDSSGTIDFGDEALTTTGTITGGDALIANITIGTSSITSASGAIDFGDEALTTTGLGTFGELNVNNARLINNTLESKNAQALKLKSVEAAKQILVEGVFEPSGGVWDFGTALSPWGDGLFNGTVSASILDATTRVEANTMILTTGSIIDTTGTISFGDEDLITSGELSAGQVVVDNITINGNLIQATAGNLNLNSASLIGYGQSLQPTNDNTQDIGDGTHRVQDLYIGSNFKDGTDTFIVSEFMELRNVMYRDAARTQAVQDGDTLFYDSASGTWLANHPDTEITHNELSGLTDGDAGHTQFAVLAGRSGGQTLQGGTGAGEDLLLESTADGSKGNVKVSDTFIPDVNASYSGGWTGLDIGGSSNYFRHIYSKGEHFGLRIENVGALPGASANNKGRLIYLTTNDKLYKDKGGTWETIGGATKCIICFVQEKMQAHNAVAFDGSQTTKNIDVSGSVGDARTADFSLLDNSNDYAKMYVSLKATSASNVRVTTNIPLPAGNYTLIGFE